MLDPQETSGFQEAEPQGQSLPETLSVGNILSHSFRWGLGQYVRILLMLILWALTVWIPYVNIGTTIAILAGAPILLSRRQQITPTFIFDRQYRDVMADWLVLQTLRGGAILLGLLFLVIPGIVVSVGWILAPLLLVDRKHGILESMSQSWHATQGKKWAILLGALVVYLLYAIPAYIIYGILYALLPAEETITSILLGLYAMLAYAGWVAVNVGFTAFIYAVLTRRHS
jgi:hypothetical protein